MAELENIDAYGADWLNDLTRSGYHRVNEYANWHHARGLMINDADTLIDWLKERRIPVDTFLTSPVAFALSEEVKQTLIKRREEVV